jgi:DNA polymerase-3 subunit alpha
VPPNINISEGYFSILDDAIVYALGAIKNVSVTFGELIVQERLKNGAFKNIIDFMERISPKSINRRSLENLIKAGCFDALHQNRNQLLLSVQKLISYSLSYHVEKSSSQFSLINVNSVSNDILVQAEPTNLRTLAFDEFEVLGLFLNNHPLSEHQILLERLDVKNSLNYTEIPSGSNQIKIAGVIQKKDARMSPRGRFITLQLSDQYGIFDITIFSEEVLKTYVSLLNIKTEIIAHCDAFKDEGNIRLTAKSFSSIEDSTKEIKIDLKIYPKTLVELAKVIDLLNARINNESGNATASIILSADNNFVGKINLPKSFFLESEDLKTFQDFYY